MRFREQGEGGRLILVGSPAGQRASFGQTAYSASKGAIVAMMRTWAVEHAKIGVTVNAVVPTALTRMVATIPGLGELVEKVDRGEPVPEHVRRQGLGTPDDVAPLVVYLASAESSGVTGQAIAVGGDRIALWTHPAQVAEQLRPGGWTPEAVRDLFATDLKGELQDHLPAPFDLGGE